MATVTFKYLHKQEQSAENWRIEHGLLAEAENISISVYDEDGVEMSGGQFSSNKIIATIEFSVPKAGYAIITATVDLGTPEDVLEYRTYLTLGYLAQIASQITKLSMPVVSIDNNGSAYQMKSASDDPQMTRAMVMSAMKRSGNLEDLRAEYNNPTQCCPD